MLLDRGFYDRDTVVCAQELLGCEIFVETNEGVKLSGTITETEAYCGVADLACHASKGRTKRTEVMFGPPGFSYIYMIYGMYFCLNLVTESEGNACAVLIRGIKTPEGLVLNGPGKTCRYLQLDKTFNSLDLTEKERIWVEKRKNAPVKFKTDRRVGIDYAGEWKDKPLRFILTEK